MRIQLNMTNSSLGLFQLLSGLFNHDLTEIKKVRYNTNMQTIRLKNKLSSLLHI